MGKLSLFGVPFFLFLALTFGKSDSAQAASDNIKISAQVTRVSGSGVAKVRRVAGVESVVGENTELYPGDVVHTDDASQVEITLADGTIIRVGLRSDFKVESVKPSGGLLRWVFQLGSGTVRALVEKTDVTQRKQGEPKFRLNTPSGTIGIRGTEVLVTYDPVSGQTMLYTIDGDVEFGSLNCAAKRSCLSVKGGESSAIKKGATAPARISRFSPRDLLGLNKYEGAKALSQEEIAARVGVLRGLRASGSPVAPSSSDADLEKLVSEARNTLQEAQDSYLGRTKEMRLEIHKAKADGTFLKKVKVGEAYLSVRKDAAENAHLKDVQIGTVGDKKYALGNAIAKSPAFSDGKKQRVAMDRDGTSPGGTSGGAGESTAGSTNSKSRGEVEEVESNSQTNGGTKFSATGVSTSRDVEALVREGENSLNQAYHWAEEVNKAQAQAMNSPTKSTPDSAHEHQDASSNRVGQNSGAGTTQAKTSATTLVLLQDEVITKVHQDVIQTGGGKYDCFLGMFCKTRPIQYHTTTRTETRTKTSTSTISSYTGSCKLKCTEDRSACDGLSKKGKVCTPDMIRQVCREDCSGK